MYVREDNALHTSECTQWANDDGRQENWIKGWVWD
jgi:hypothetical protein